jgi:hypothetical protein
MYILPMNIKVIRRILKVQHPSWNIAAIVFFEQISTSVNRWKMNRTKLILIIALGPMQASPPPVASGH